MKKTPSFLTLWIVTLLVACGPQTVATPNRISATDTPTLEEKVPTQTSIATAATAPPPFAGTEISYGPVRLVLPPEIATGASGTEIPPFDSEEGAWFQKTPGHTQIDLGDYYVLQGKSHQPQIYIYPAQSYAELVPAAFESMHRLNNILGNPGAPISNQTLPAVPFFNEIPAFAANIQVISFQNGQGVRFLSEYGQSATSANNHDLFYQFQGLTSDGTYYVVAIFPIRAPGLGESSDPTAAVPIAGIAFPSMGDPNADWERYFAAVTHYLDAIPADTFTPTLSQLDALIQSMLIVP